MRLKDILIEAVSAPEFEDTLEKVANRYKLSPQAVDALRKDAMFVLQQGYPSAAKLGDELSKVAGSEKYKGGQVQPTQRHNAPKSVVKGPATPPPVPVKAGQGNVQAPQSLPSLGSLATQATQKPAEPEPFWKQQGLPPPEAMKPQATDKPKTTTKERDPSKPLPGPINVGQKKEPEADITTVDDADIMPADDELPTNVTPIGKGKGGKKKIDMTTFGDQEKAAASAPQKSGKRSGGEKPGGKKSGGKKPSGKKSDEKPADTEKEPAEKDGMPKLASLAGEKPAEKKPVGKKKKEEKPEGYDETGGRVDKEWTGWKGWKKGQTVSVPWDQEKNKYKVSDILGNWPELKDKEGNTYFYNQDLGIRRTKY